MVENILGLPFRTQRKAKELSFIETFLFHITDSSWMIPILLLFWPRSWFPVRTHDLQLKIWSNCPTSTNRSTCINSARPIHWRRLTDGRFARFPTSLAFSPLTQLHPEDFSAMKFETLPSISRVGLGNPCGIVWLTNRVWNLSTYQFGK